MYLSLGEIISEMEKHSPLQPMRIGFTHAHSYRGDYYQLGVEPIQGTTIGDSLAILKGAIGKTFQGYKGGDYTMHDETSVYISVYGEGDGDKLGSLLLAYMLGADPVAALGDKLERTWPGHIQGTVEAKTT